MKPPAPVTPTRTMPHPPDNVMSRSGRWADAAILHRRTPLPTLAPRRARLRERVDVHEHPVVVLPGVLVLKLVPRGEAHGGVLLGMSPEPCDLRRQVGGVAAAEEQARAAGRDQGRR